jgi:hypothetical protein
MGHEAQAPIANDVRISDFTGGNEYPTAENYESRLPIGNLFPFVMGYEFQSPTGHGVSMEQQLRFSDRISCTIFQSPSVYEFPIAQGILLPNGSGVRFPERQGDTSSHSLRTYDFSICHRDQVTNHPAVGVSVFSMGMIA